MAAHPLVRGQGVFCGLLEGRAGDMCARRNWQGLRGSRSEHFSPRGIYKIFMTFAGEYPIIYYKSARMFAKGVQPF